MNFTGGGASENSSLKGLITDNLHYDQYIDNMLNININTDVKMKKNAFTLAEVLITLGIIGIVAAMTLPSLIKNYRLNILHNQFKKSYATLSQVLERMYADDGVLPMEMYPSISDFTAKYVSYLVNASRCEDCVKSDGQLNVLYRNLSNKSYTFSYPFAGKVYKLADGTTLWFSYGLYDRCAIIVDLNGISKSPNRIGIDTFAFIIKNNGKMGDVTEEIPSWLKPECCSLEHNHNHNGWGCTGYALSDVSPDNNNSGSYWKDFLGKLF